MKKLNIISKKHSPEFNEKINKVVIPVAGLGTKNVAGNKGNSKRNASHFE